MIKIEILNTKVYGLHDSIIKSGYPMQTEISFNILTSEMKDTDFDRAERLGKTPIGSGHDNYLKGVIVQADFTAPQYWWIQAERYNWFDFVSSQSKMHRILKMNLTKQCNEYVDIRVVNILEEYIELYNNLPKNDNAKRKVFHKIISNTPMGLNLTAGITTNYLQLKTMVFQRRNHKMDDWSVDFIEWCNSLPMFLDLISELN